MPEHVHLPVSEPATHLISTVLHALKLSVSKLSLEHPFWHSRYYDFNVFTTRKQIEKLRYLHRNPVSRGLIARPDEWPWSSFRHDATSQKGIAQIESFWTEAMRHGRLPISAPADMHCAAAAPTLTDSQKQRIGEGGAPTGHHSEPDAPASGKLYLA